jgi:phage-related protein
MAERFVNDNDKLGEGLGDLTGNVQGVIGSVKGLSTALSTSGQGFMALVGPIAL